MTIKICVVSSSRADYGILKNLIIEMKASSEFDLKLIVTGSHLSRKHGYTILEILSDGIKVDKKIITIKKTNKPIDIANNFSETVTKMIEPITNIKPDVIILLGDRYEILATSISATILNIPIAHIHGGEITEGAMDNAMRHSITKLAHIHFVSNQVHKQRLIQMGELPKNIHNVGALGVENLLKIKLLTLKELEQSINFKMFKKNILVTYHPVTLDEKPIEGLDYIMKALKNLNQVGIIFTLSNADIKGEKINKKILRFVKNKSNAVAFYNLGQLKYLSCLKHCDLILGNSSSGIIEAPSFGKVTINVGDRQKGRLKAKSVFDVDIDENEIKEQITKTLNNDFKIKINEISNPYYKKDSTKNIMSFLLRSNYKKLVHKKFFDFKFDLLK